MPTLARAPILASSSGTRPVSRRQIIQATGPLPAPGGRGRATLARAHRPVTRAPSSLPHCSSFSYPPGKPPTPRSLPPFPATRPSHCRAPGQPTVLSRALALTGPGTTAPGTTRPAPPRRQGREPPPAGLSFLLTPPAPYRSGFSCPRAFAGLHPRPPPAALARDDPTPAGPSPGAKSSRPPRA